MNAHRFEINLVQKTEESARAFVEALDRQIIEVQENLDKLKTTRGSVARIFGIDRRDNPTPMQSLLDSASRSLHEIDEGILAKDLELVVKAGA